MIGVGPDASILYGLLCQIQPHVLITKLKLEEEYMATIRRVVGHFREPECSRTGASETNRRGPEAEFRRLLAGPDSNNSTEEFEPLSEEFRSADAPKFPCRLLFVRGSFFNLESGILGSADHS